MIMFMLSHKTFATNSVKKTFVSDVYGFTAKFSVETFNYHFFYGHKITGLAYKVVKRSF